ncbi:hypothetical protein ACNQGB_11645 [Flavobacterium sp. XS1P32]|uniref:hypothetical protein n=1 Tax=Flavobacterium sp. XS1P32 TaxID=3401726 RepID=UPI003AB049F8
MGKNYFSKKVLQVSMLFFLILTTNVFAQVGIGTVTPNASSVLDITSTTQGMLTPRMTTAQRTAIASPADGLMVYDTDLKAFHYYNSSTATWTVMNSAASGRLKFKRIRSTDVLATVLATELAAGGGAKYVLDSATHYEINGIVTFNFPIDLNNASLIGIDTNEDILFKTSGFLFDGASGGVVKNLTIAGGSSVFNLIGSGNTQGLIFRDCIVSGSANVGTISGFALVFFSIVNYLGNTTGITYTNCSRVLLSNTAWFGNNAGTFEKFTGTFSLLQKQGGFSEVNGAATGVDVSTNPAITGDAVMESVVFTGTVSTGKYVNGYTVGTYSGYNFNNNWNVRCAGIPTEGDSFATGSVHLDRVPASPSGTLPDTNATYKVPGTTISSNLFRMDGATANRLVYLGKKSRTFSVSASISFEGDNGSTDLLFYFVKSAAGGTPITLITSSETFIDSNNTNIQSIAVLGTVTLANGEYVELCIRRLNGSNKLFTFRSYNMSIK